MNVGVCRMRTAAWRNMLSIFLMILLVVGCRNRTSTEGNAISSPEVLKSYIPDDGGIYFTDITSAAGINFKHSFGDDSLSNLVESDGGGAAFLDYDKDGYMDIFMTTGTYDKKVNKNRPVDPDSHNCLYRNLGNGSFVDVTNEYPLSQ